MTMLNNILFFTGFEYFIQAESQYIIAHLIQQSRLWQYPATSGLPQFGPQCQRLTLTEANQ